MIVPSSSRDAQPAVESCWILLMLLILPPGLVHIFFPFPLTFTNGREGDIMIFITLSGSVINNKAAFKVEVPFVSVDRWCHAARARSGDSPGGKGLLRWSAVRWNRKYVYYNYSILGLFPTQITMNFLQSHLKYIYFRQTLLTLVMYPLDPTLIQDCTHSALFYRDSLARFAYYIPLFGIFHI